MTKVRIGQVLLYLYHLGFFTITAVTKDYPNHSTQ